MMILSVLMVAVLGPQTGLATISTTVSTLPTPTVVVETDATEPVVVEPVPEPVIEVMEAVPFDPCHPTGCVVEATVSGPDPVPDFSLFVATPILATSAPAPEPAPSPSSFQSSDEPPETNALSACEIYQNLGAPDPCPLEIVDDCTGGSEECPLPTPGCPPLTTGTFPDCSPPEEDPCDALGVDPVCQCLDGILACADPCSGDPNLCETQCPEPTAGEFPVCIVDPCGIGALADACACTGHLQNCVPDPCEIAPCDPCADLPEVCNPPCVDRPADCLPPVGCPDQDGDDDSDLQDCQRIVCNLADTDGNGDCEPAPPNTCELQDLDGNGDCAPDLGCPDQDGDGDLDMVDCAALLCEIQDIDGNGDCTADECIILDAADTVDNCEPGFFCEDGFTVGCTVDEVCTVRNVPAGTGRITLQSVDDPYYGVGRGPVAWQEPVDGKWTNGCLGNEKDDKVDGSWKVPHGFQPYWMPGNNTTSVHTGVFLVAEFEDRTDCEYESNWYGFWQGNEGYVSFRQTATGKDDNGHVRFGCSGPDTHQKPNQGTGYGGFMDAPVR